MSSINPAQQQHKHLLGHTIADGRLELVSILGLGAYGVVYLARDLTHPLHRQPFASSSSSDLPRILASRHGGAASGYYAVKCLNKVDLDNRQKRFQRREIVLHTMVTGHPSVVTLYRVIDEKDDPCIYVILDYCPDGDLFSMITETQRYSVPIPQHDESKDMLSGKPYDVDTDEVYQAARAEMDDTVRNVFCQILDAVSFCHANGIYHRDLKPENILCLQGGAKVVLADFGLATHEKASSDFGCGSTFYMGPECQGGISTHLDNYGTAANDIWSLGVILVNLICGRNPWKQACIDDETFREYLRNPDFLMDILPISKQTNAVLKRIFTVREEWRCSLSELRAMIHQVDRFTATQSEQRERQRQARHAAQRARQEAQRARAAAEEARREAEIRHGVENVYAQADGTSITFPTSGAQDSYMQSRPVTPSPEVSQRKPFDTPSSVDSSTVTVATPGCSFSPGSSVSEASSVPPSPLESESDMLPDNGSSCSASSASRRCSYGTMPATPIFESMRQRISSSNKKQMPSLRRASVQHGIRVHQQQPTLAVQTARATGASSTCSDPDVDGGELQTLAIQSLLPHANVNDFVEQHRRRYEDENMLELSEDGQSSFVFEKGTQEGNNATSKFNSVPAKRGLRRAPIAANARRLRNNIFGA